MISVCFTVTNSALKVSLLEVFLVRIFQYLDWIRRDTPYLSLFTPTQGNTDQKNSEYEHFLRSVINSFQVNVPLPWKQKTRNFFIFLGEVERKKLNKLLVVL